ncbi:unnamed protein product, partial [Mesorhabditis belari]|uniref:Protein kinase domain-containing protein n=1 Tax=Mesorhabditis belari TaxID=2138241 RepID=A0AAF3EVT8_9BILA
MGDIELPEEYKPDTKDRFYRPPKLSENKHVYHVIASGNFADIIAAVNRDGKPVAAKRYKIEQLNQTIDGYTRLRREIQISRFNRHENIVEFYDVFVEKPENPTHIWLVTERMDHTLEKYFEHLRRKDEKSEPVKRDLRHIGALLTQLLRALDYIHQRGIMHRDVTPRNIGMNQKEFEIKLLDFGLARETNPKLDHSTNVDTPYIYKSLEVFMRTKYNTGIDVWAAALVALEMLGMKLFMPTGTDDEITKKIRKRGAENAVKDRIFTVLGVPEDQYQSIFGRPIQERPHAGEFDKIWEEKIEPRLDRDIGPLRREDFKDLIKKMLDPNLQQRLRADECLLHPFLRILNEKYDQRASSLDFEEVMGDIELPEEYKPDTKDRFYRPPKLSENKHVYHVIASGNFADIIAAVNRDGKSVAAKRYKIEQLNQTIDGYTRLRREIQISRFNRHENIVEFYDVFVEKPENPTHIWLVTERMDHTLEKYFEHLRRNDEKSEPVKRDLRHIGALLTQLLRALDYIHQRGIMHRDVTPQNIGMNQKEFEIKLLNFGLARETSRQLYETGTDIRAVALVILELLTTGSDQIQSNAVQLINENEFEVTWRTKIESRLGPDILKRDDCKDLLKKMLHPNSERRPSAAEYLNHGFLTALNPKKNEDQKSENQVDRDFFLHQSLFINQLLFDYQPDSRTRSPQDSFFASLTIPDFLP